MTPENWVMVDYDLNSGDADPTPGGWYGLKGGDGIVRGVPEGTRADWVALIKGLRGDAPEVRIHKRLRWDAEWGVYSPRNTHPDERIFRGLSRQDLADRLEYLLAHPVEWTPDRPATE